MSSSDSGLGLRAELLAAARTHSFWVAILRQSIPVIGVFALGSATSPPPPY